MATVNLLTMPMDRRRIRRALKATAVAFVKFKTLDEQDNLTPLIPPHPQ